MRKLSLFAVSFCLVVATVLAHTRNVLEPVLEWNLLEYDFPTSKDRQDAINNGNLVVANGIPIDVAPFFNALGKLRVFTTIPRFQTGVPYSLATITHRRGSTGPSLQPYPSYEWHSSHGTNCDGITSAFRVAITECNQMWVIDSGSIGSVQHCPPQLLLFDLNTDKLLHRYRFTNSVYIPMASLLITPIVVTRDPPPSGNCQRSMVYIADVTYHGIVVYDQMQNTAWRTENKYMYPDPNIGTHSIAGETFTLMDGILGMSTDNRNLYFHPLASTSEYAVALSVLDNQANWANGVEAMQNEFKPLGNRGSQCAAEVVDSRNNLYCVTFNPIRLISWNVKTPFRQKNFRTVSDDANMLQFVSGMKVIKNMAGKEELWLISNRFQKIAAGTQNPNEINFRILRRNINDLQNGIDVSHTNTDLHNRLIFS